MTTKRNALPLYRQVLSDAWRLTLTHKHLWIFGFFATFIGFGGVSEVFFGAYNRFADVLPSSVGIQETPLLMLPGFATIRALISLSPHPIVSLVFFTAAVVLLFAVFAWIISLAVGALVASIRKIERGGTPNFSEGLRAGSTAVGRVFSINILAKIAVGVAFLLTGANLMNILLDRSWVSAFFFLASYVVFTLLAIAISLISVYATNSTVVDELPVVPSLNQGLHLLKKNWLISLEMMIFLLLINVGLAILALICAMVLSVPLVFLFLFAAVIKSGALMTVMITLTLIMLIAVMVIAGSFLTTFQASTWTLLWIRLSGREAHHPKIVRVAEWLQQKLNGKLMG
ncbi:hypothetical protein KKF05_04470 [Patescibacteria group bacterium]|nr:hypothetical protein [Patescibacteria group bacterium]MBU1028584.1 hypothetical protein [Patescibacteria group bacterium]MBU1916126.1 hypothetical protein [Patescibacteria group bacterium]